MLNLHVKKVEERKKKIAKLKRELQKKYVLLIFSALLYFSIPLPPSSFHKVYILYGIEIFLVLNSTS